MTIQKRVKKKHKLNRTWLFIYLAIISSMLITSFSVAKYHSQQTDNIAAFEIGKPIITITNVSQDELNNIKRDVEFNIQNYELDSNDTDIITEVALVYNLQIVNNNNINFTYTLYKNAKETENIITMINNKTPDYTLTHTVKQTDTYILEIDFNEAPSPEDAINAIIIDVNASQQM